VTTDSERLDRIVVVLESIARKVGARVPPTSPRTPPTEEQLRGLVSSVRRRGRAHEPESDEKTYPTSTTTPERFWSREDR
jgi:hypothetical protein